MAFYFMITCLLALAALVRAHELEELEYAPGYLAKEHTIPRYSFEYSVKDPSTGDNKVQWEKREGDGVKGSYSLVEPGGGIRTIDYWADDKSGFNAIIRREGVKVHPLTLKAAPMVKYAPVYDAMHDEPIAPIAHYGPKYGAVSSLIVRKVSMPTPKLALPVHIAPVVAAAPAIAPIAKTIMPGSMLPLPLMHNYIPSLDSFAHMNKLV